MKSLPLSTGFNARRLRANLLRNGFALERLEALGLNRSLVENAGLGIKEPYVTAGGVEVAGVVTYPLQTNGDRWRYGYIAIAGVTQNFDHPAAWSPGEACTACWGVGPTLLVLASPLSMLQARASIERRGLGIAVIASSQTDRMPTEWASNAFWSTWDRIILSGELSETSRRRIAMCADRPLETSSERVVGSVHDSVSSGDLDEWVDALLVSAIPFGHGPDGHRDAGEDVGDFTASPISLFGGVAGDRMYFPFGVERRRAATPGGALLCSYETVVLRSDGALLEARTLAAPRGTPRHKRVHALTDGTRITAPPEVSGNATWSLDAIQRFMSRRAEGADPCERSAVEIVEDVHEFIASRVRLPHDDDLWVATAFVLLTHVFRVFPAIPLLLVEGGKGTGKTELATTIASLAFNAVTMGQGSAAALVRVAKECGGLVVLDDVEGLSAGGQGFGELSQCLKTGYRASTAVKPVVLPSGRVESFDFFGPRVLTCTRGVDPILSSRCIRIVTAAASASIDAITKNEKSLSPDGAALRDELHALGMSRAFAVRDSFIGLTAGGNDRITEIWSPLLAIMQTLHDGGPVAALRRAQRRLAP